MPVPPDVPRCRTCPYWTGTDPDPGGIGGYCTRFPPAPVPRAAADPSEFELAWPITNADDHCGEHPDHPARRDRAPRPLIS